MIMLAESGAPPGNEVLLGPKARDHYLKKESGMSDRYSKLFAEYSHNVAWEDLSSETIHEIKRRVLDNIGVSIAPFSIRRSYA